MERKRSRRIRRGKAMLGGEKEELRRIPFFLKISSQLAKDLIFQQ
jgi:hypothetical protein